MVWVVPLLNVDDVLRYLLQLFSIFPGIEIIRVFQRDPDNIFAAPLTVLNL